MYLDDIIILSKDARSRIQDVEKILSVFKDVGFHRN